MKTRRPVVKVVEVDGVAYLWAVHREPQWCSMDGWKGLCLEINPADGSGLPLFLELPFSITARRSTPQRQRPKVIVSDLQHYIQRALAAGWSPDSRGKPFVFEAQH